MPGHMSRYLIREVSKQTLAGSNIFSVLTILPSPKPQQDQLEIMTSSVLDELIEYREIESTLFGFNHFPRHASKDGVDVHVLHLLPDARHVRWRGERRVLQLCSKDQIRLVMDDQLSCIVRFDDSRKAVLSHL